MCGRYFWTDEAEDAFEEDFPDLAGEFLGMRAGDYTPGMRALALIGGGVGAAGGPAVQSKGAGREHPESGIGTESQTSGVGQEHPALGVGQEHPASGVRIENPVTGLRIEPLLWGFPGFDKGKLLINARAESVKDRPTFADSFAERRCVLPAAGFYEWDRKKEKVIFTVPERKILYLAGIYRPYGEENRFVILTREANASMAPVHDRMPLILSRGEVGPWVRGVNEADDILAKKLPLLRAERPYEQMTFEW